jgi:hypothetical protein
MRATFIFLGIVLLLAGGAALIHPRWANPSDKKEVDIDNHKVIFETTRYTVVPRAWSGAAVVAGGILFLIGTLGSIRKG